MTVNSMREWLKDSKTCRYAYSVTWKDRVDRMPDTQVMAVYFRLSCKSSVVSR